MASENNNRIGRFQDILGTGYGAFGVRGVGHGQVEQPIDVVIATIPKP